MNLTEKTSKLLPRSVIINATDKKMWADRLPKLDQAQVQVIYDVLVREVRAWKREGISIIPDPALEMQLLPTAEHGATASDLKARLAGGAPKAPEKTQPSVPPPAPKPLPAPVQPEEAELEIDQAKPQQPIVPENNAWMLSKDVVVPKAANAPMVPSAKSIPKIRNRVPKHGLQDLGKIRSIEDLEKLEAAHLRQGPLRDQLAFIRQRITQLAGESDMLAVSVIPVFERSPLFKTYLKAGAMMIEANSGGTKYPLEQVMADMENQGQETLSQEEFEALTDLRKELDTIAGL